MFNIYNLYNYFRILHTVVSTLFTKPVFIIFIAQSIHKIKIFIKVRNVTFFFLSEGSSSMC